jgi:hypothetical protein
MKKINIKKKKKKKKKIEKLQKEQFQLVFFIKKKEEKV